MQINLKDKVDYNKNNILDDKIDNKTDKQIKKRIIFYLN